MAIAVARCRAIVGVRRRRRADGQDARTEALAAADAFFDRYLQPSGRIARTDQGGDTVSEGQAYAMLLAAATATRSASGGSGRGPTSTCSAATACWRGGGRTAASPTGARPPTPT